jgi:hypothetical protein
MPQRRRVHLPLAGEVLNGGTETAAPAATVYRGTAISSELQIHLVGGLAASNILGQNIETGVSDIVSLCKLPQMGMAQTLLNEGFKPDDFPGPIETNGDFLMGRLILV